MWTPKAFVFDLDGLILDTESLCVEVARQVLAAHGAELTIGALCCAAPRLSSLLVHKTDAPAVFPTVCVLDVTAFHAYGGCTMAAADTEAQHAALGKRPLDCWRDAAAVLQLDVPAEQLVAESEPLLQER
jgi:hypothetical protein